jgi:hypothetical protein
MITMTAPLPHDWRGRVLATAAQVATAERLIRDGKAEPITIRDYPKARVYLQLRRLVDGQRRGEVYIAPDGRVLGYGYTLTEARRNGRSRR